MPQSISSYLAVMTLLLAFCNGPLLAATELPVHASQNEDRYSAGTVPNPLAPFAQVFRDDLDGAISLYLAQPNGQAIKKLTGATQGGFYPIVAETPSGGFVAMWYVSGSGLRYALTNRYGDVVKPLTKLSDYSGAALQTSDTDPAVAVAPDGRIGVLWRHAISTATFETNSNIYFAILDPLGSVLSGPVDLTHNTLWGQNSSLGVPQFSSPHIAALENGSFAVAWGQMILEAPTGACAQNCSVTDVYYAILGENGTEIKPMTRATHDTPGTDNAYFYPTLTPLSGSRALLAYMQASDRDIYLTVLNSLGAVVRPATNLTNNGTTKWDGWPDAAQLSNGNILVAWRSSAPIAFALLDPSFNIIAGPTALATNPAAQGGENYVSVAPDNMGRASLTWTDYDGNNRRNIFYALVGSAGEVVTPAAILLTGQGGTPHLRANDMGYGATTYSWSPPDKDATVSLNSALYGAAPGANATIEVRYANRGGNTLTGVVVTAILASDLTYISDTSGVPPIPTREMTMASTSGTTLTWHFPDLGFLEARSFTLTVGTPAQSAYGQCYAVEVSITGTDMGAGTGHNSTSADVMTARQTFLPMIVR